LTNEIVHDIIYSIGGVKMDFFNYKEYMTREQFAHASTIANEEELL